MSKLNKFKIGDKVKLVREDPEYGDYCIGEFYEKIGNIYTVTGFAEEGTICVEETDYIFKSSMFDLVSTTDEDQGHGVTITIKDNAGISPDVITQVDDVTAAEIIELISQYQNGEGEEEKYIIEFLNDEMAWSKAVLGMDIIKDAELVDEDFIEGWKVYNYDGVIYRVKKE